VNSVRLFCAHARNNLRGKQTLVLVEKVEWHRWHPVQQCPSVINQVRLILAVVPNVVLCHNVRYAENEEASILFGTVEVHVNDIVG
jgi:uncharacterized Fe-S radical SAM superfamily protein PflX